jgi:GNAT superfamily N-acetyltransferase
MSKLPCASPSTNSHTPHPPMRRWLEAFVTGFSETRSLTHPYTVREIRPSIWLLADAPRRSGPYRKSELVVWNQEMETVMDALQEAGDRRVSLSVMAADTECFLAEKARYKGLGFRSVGSEPLFVADLSVWTPPSSLHADIVRVASQDQADRIRKAARGRQISPAELASSTPAVRLYAAFHGETPVGWVHSVTTHLDCAWVSNLFVCAEARGQGIGRSLMATMLTDDIRHGIRESVLLASGAGARLYPHLGYAEQGILGIFTR